MLHEECSFASEPRGQRNEKERRSSKKCFSFNFREVRSRYSTDKIEDRSMTRQLSTIDYRLQYFYVLRITYYSSSLVAGPSCSLLFSSYLLHVIFNYFFQFLCIKFIGDQTITQFAFQHDEAKFSVCNLLVHAH